MNLADISGLNKNKRNFYSIGINSLMPISLMFSVFLSIFVAGACTANPKDGNAIKNSPYLYLNTEKGPITIRLYQSAAPRTVDKLIKLVNSPAKPVSNASKANLQHRLYDQLEINYTVPHIEIRTSTPKGLAGLKLPKEINAESLGLDKRLIKDSAEAMNIWQFKILKHYSKHKKAGTASPRLKEWVKKWGEQKNVNFLIGVSAKEINEALDFKYVQGIVSYPVKKGAVMLKSASTKESGAELVIALADLPTRTGKWAVIGEVVRGLETAEKISLLPNSGMKKPKFKPVNPVKITKTEVKIMK